VKGPAVLALAVLLMGIAVWWVGPDSDWDKRCPAELTQEGSSGYDVTPSIWPPGTRCTGEAPNGEHIEATYVPWPEWLFSLAVAALVGGSAALVVRGVRARSDRGESLSDTTSML